MSILDSAKKAVQDKLKERDEINKIKHDAYKEAYKEEVKAVAKEKAREDAIANKYSLREKLKHGLLEKMKEKKKKPSVLYDKDEDDSGLSPAFKKAFEK